MDDTTPQMKMLKLTWANLNWDDGAESNEYNFFSLPEPSSLNSRERDALEWVVERDKQKFECMPMLRDRFDYQVAPLFLALLQSPQLAELWAQMGNFFLTGDRRGTITEYDRAWLDLGVNPLLVGGRTQAGYIGVFAAHGISVDEIVAVRESRLDVLKSEAREIVDLAQGTIRGSVTAEQFQKLASQRGAKWVIEAIAHAAFKYISATVFSTMWRIQGVEGGDEIAEEMIRALQDGKLSAQPMMDKGAFARTIDLDEEVNEQ